MKTMKNILVLNKTLASKENIAREVCFTFFIARPKQGSAWLKVRSIM